MTIGDAVSGGTATRVLFVDGSGNLGQDADLTFSTDTLTATKIIGSTSITDSGLTATRVVFAGAAGLLSDDSDLTFATDTLTATKIASTTFTGAVTIDGSADAIQLKVQGHSTQTTQPFVVEKSDGTDIFSITNDALATTLTSTALTVGATSSATPTDLVIAAQDGVGTDISGATFYHDAGRPTGAGNGGSHIFRTAPTGGAGSTPGTLTNRFVIDDEGAMTLSGPTSVASIAATGVPLTVTGFGGGSAKTLVVNNGTSTGAIAEFQDNGTPTVTVPNGGGLSVNTTAADQLFYSKTVTLTEGGAAELVATFTSTTTNSFGVEFSYRVHAKDATPDYAIRQGSFRFACVNNATTVTCAKDATNETDDESVIINTSSKTLTYAIALDVATANVAKVTFDIDSDMTVNGAYITWTAIVHGPVTVS
jgi:hypothetical protein